MKWSKLKNMIICFLLAMNLFMLSFIAFDSYKKSVIPDNVIKASFKVLEDSGFKCSKEDFPKYNHYLPQLNVTFYSASDLSELFFGRQVAFGTSDNSLVAKHDGAVLKVYSNHFAYTTGKPSKKASEKELKKALKSLGIDTKSIVFDKKEKCFYKMYKNYNLFNMYINIELDKQGEICNMSAQWPKEIVDLGREKIAFTESLTKLKKAFPSGGNIKKIELGYSLRFLGGEKYKFVPAWRVNIDGEIKILE